MQTLTIKHCIDKKLILTNTYICKELDLHKNLRNTKIMIMRNIKYVRIFFKYFNKLLNFRFVIAFICLSSCY